ncbi:hypothetical protein INT47_006371 [Mucor saturninus]|uniref:Uncharacterized protein n=1 Tax=Mucor saturninus TaxID=64648 RepID=A0A8H7V5U7_9FUNG|nr:hypothetical protein INT47_006371 [Mucor saturninus]
MKYCNLITVSLCALDPSRSQVFAASYGDGKSGHKLKKCSTKEYYTYTGSKRHMKKEIERIAAMETGDALLNITTAKTVNISTYIHYFTYILLNLDQILEFNGSLTAKDRFYLYQGVQRARAEMTDGIREYNKRKRKNTKKNRKKKKRDHRQ